MGTARVVSTENMLTSNPVEVAVAVPSVDDAASAERSVPVTGATLILEAIWQIHPRALAASLESRGETPWIDGPRALGGMTLQQIVNPSTTSPTHTPRFRLEAWVLTCQDAGPVRRLMLETFDVAGDTAEVQGDFAHLTPHLTLRNGRTDRLSVDIRAQGRPLLRLTRLAPPQSEEIIWAQSALPEILGLKGGQYELERVIFGPSDSPHS